MSINTFKDKQLEKCWLSGKCAKVNTKLRRRLLNRLDYLDAAMEIADMAFPASNKLHPLKGELEDFWAISINGPWRLIFQFINANAYDVYYDNYH